MIAYVTLGTNDLPRAIEYFEKLLGSLGATDEGKSGQRAEGFYPAYFRDLDGNKLNCYFMG